VAKAGATGKPVLHASRRRAALRKARTDRKVDALLVSCREDVGYLTGFAGEDSVVAFGPNWACLITDGRFAEQAGKQCPGLEIHVRTGSMTAAIAAILKGHGVRRLGVQAEHMTLQVKDRLDRAAVAGRIVPVQNVTASLRAVKDADELRLIRRAIAVAEGAFRDLTAKGVRALIGRSEQEVAADLDYRMRLLGAIPAFDTIVAAGPHASQPHYLPGRTPVRHNNAVLIDWGASVGGYCSDLTRVVFTGRIRPELSQAYDVVLRAQAAGIAAARPGVVCRTVDAAARKVIEQAGYGKQFLHGLGHGFGRAVHEAPTLGARSTDRLRDGMVVTVEPGIYLPGIGGIRIEDDILVTSHGPRRLSSLPRGLQAVTLW
jgi:Xaa-Pro aminopeptidase